MHPRTSTTDRRERVFFISADLRKTPLGWTLTYGELASGRTYTQPDPLGLAAGANPYLYVQASPLVLSDPQGLNPALALYRAGMTGYRVGEAINPTVQPYIAQVVDALLLPDPMNDTLVLAQNNKQIRKRIEGLQNQIDRHKQKLDKEPDCDASNHWREEVKIWESEIQRLRQRLPNGK